MFVPQGYVSVGDAISRLNKAWLEQGKLIAPWDAAEAVGIALASKQVRCFGIVDEKGVLVEVPNNHWLTSEGRQIIAEPASRIKSIGGRSTYDILPIIPEVDFGGQFPEGGYQHAKPPTIWPEGYKTEEAELPALNYSGELGMKAPPKSRGGRQEKYDWDGFWVEVARFVYVSGIESDDRVKCQKHMESWTATNWEEAPGISTIRDKLLKLFASPVTFKK